MSGSVRRRLLDDSPVTDPHRSLWRLPALRRLLLVSIVGFSSFFFTMSALPLWATQGGAGPAQAGLVTTVMLVATVAAQGLVPGIVARIGSGPALALGLVLLGAPSPLYALSNQLVLLLPVSAVRGLGFALLTVIGALLTSQVAPRERHGETVGIYGLAVALPNLLAMPAGVALTSAGQFRWVAVLSSASVLLAPAARGLGRLGTDPATAAAPDGPAAERPGGSARRALLLAAAVPSLVLLVVTAAGGAVMTFLPIERPSGTLATICLLVMGATAALSRWRVGILADRFGSRVLLPGGVLIAVLGMTGVAFALARGSAAEVLLVVSCSVLGVGYGVVQNLTLVIAFARAGDAGEASASAVWNAAFDSGTALGAVGVGAIAEAGPGMPGAFGITALIVALMLPVAVRVAFLSTGRGGTGS